MKALKKLRGKLFSDKERSKSMPEHEIDPALVRAWVTEARNAAKHFLEEIELVEYTAESGFNIMTVAEEASGVLRQQLTALERRAVPMRYTRR